MHKISNPLDSLKLEMIRESDKIINVINVIEVKLEKQLVLATKAYHNDDQPRLLKIKAKVDFLIGELGKQEKAMDAFMEKYQRILENEKEKVLSNLWSQKQIHLRGVSENKRRQRGS